MIPPSFWSVRILLSGLDVSPTAGRTTPSGGSREQGLRGTMAEAAADAHVVLARFTLARITVVLEGNHCDGSKTL
jgi:hypothetical protein